MNPSYSKIREHSQTLDHIYNETNFKMLNKARKNNELRVAESLFIHKNRSSLNSNETSVTLNIIPLRYEKGGRKDRRGMSK